MSGLKGRKEQSFCKRGHNLAIYRVGKGQDMRCRLCHNLRAKLRRKENPDESKAIGRRSVLKRKYGLTEERYEEILADQGGGCAICGRTKAESGRSLHVDHCHRTGKTRGILCHHCNTAIGLIKEDKRVIGRICQYLFGRTKCRSKKAKAEK